MYVRILQKLYTKRTKHTQTCGEKKILFGRNILEHIISMGLPFVPPPSALTGGSSVRGTAGPIWVRKGFNCFLSLYYRFLAKPKFVSTKYSLDSIYSIL